MNQRGRREIDDARKEDKKKKKRDLRERGERGEEWKAIRVGQEW